MAIEDRVRYADPNPASPRLYPNRYARYRERRQRTLCERLGKDGVYFLNERDGLKQVIGHTLESVP